MILPEFATALGCADRDVLPRLRALKLTEPCSRCKGTGWADEFERIACFKCQGHADQLPKLTRALARDVARRIVRGELNSYFAKRRRQRVTTKGTE